MNYIKIYKKIIENAKSEQRKKGGLVYYESHHIIPDFMFKNRKRKGPKGHLDGNPNDPKNLVLLTAREHILCHVLLAKALNGEKYWAQAASALTWFFTKVIGNHTRQKNNELAGLMRKYDKYRTLGLQGISNARKGTFPAVDVITGISVGSVSNKHPNVLSGLWVHVTKGRVLNEDEKELRRKLSTGKKNSNAREIDIEYIKTYMVKFDVIVKNNFDNNFIASKFEEWFDQQIHTKEFYVFLHSSKPLPQKITGLSNKFLNIRKIAEELQPILNWNIPKYGMGKYSGNLQNRTFEWYTNGTENIQIRKNDVVPDGFYKGRKC